MDNLKTILSDHALWLADEGGACANLSDADLSSADLYSANLYSANLSSADLSDADLSDANLKRAGLKRADLSSATLSGANLSGATLSGANLSGADLSGTNLSGTNLSGANLRGVDGVIDLGHESRGYDVLAVRQESGYRIKAGCRWFTPEEATAHWVDNPEMVIRIDALYALATLKGWTT